MTVFDQIAKEAKEQAEAAAEAAAAKRYEEELKFQSDLLTLTFDRARTYLNVVQLAGYGAYFAFLSVMGNALSQSQRMWSGLPILISFTTLVLFEVFKSYVLHQQIISALHVAKAQNLQGLGSA